MKFIVVTYLFMTSFGLYSQTEIDSIEIDVNLEIDSNQIIYNQKNCLKIDLIGLSLGRYYVYYERQLFKKINIELNAGLFIPNFLHQYIHPEILDLKNGYNLRAGIKYYINESFKGIFSQIHFNHLNYNRLYQTYNSETETMDSRWVNTTKNSLSLSFGNTHLLKKRFLYEHQAGISYNGKKDLKAFGAIKIGYLF